MEFRQIQYALKVAEERSFSRAAEKLHIAQPSLSQQVGKLEQQLGVKLFDRSTSPIELTYAGERFVEKAARILDALGQLQKEMEDVAEIKKGRLTIGSLPITGAHVLPCVLPLFQHQFPGIEVVLVEDTTARLEELTVKGGTDVSILTLPLEEPQLDYEVVLEEEILLAVPPNHKLTNSGVEVVRLSDLREESFIFLKQGQGFRNLANELCLQAGFEPRIVFETSNIETSKSLVATGMGLSFVPAMVAKPSGDPSLPMYLRIDNRPKRTIVAAYRHGRYLSKSTRSFIDILKQAFQTGESV